jgi:hypothetical protein
MKIKNIALATLISVSSSFGMEIVVDSDLSADEMLKFDKKFNSQRYKQKQKQKQILKFTWKDPSTGLVWQNDGANPKLNWQKAKEYCRNLSLVGLDDWRLPNIDELRTILTKNKSNKYTKKPLTKTTKERYYWSSSTYAKYSYVAWVVFFYLGVDGSDLKSNGNYVRCVRAGQ